MVQYWGGKYCWEEESKSFSTPGCVTGTPDRLLTGFLDFSLFLIQSTPKMLPHFLINFLTVVYFLFSVSKLLFQALISSIIYNLKESKWTFWRNKGCCCFSIDICDFHPLLLLLLQQILNWVICLNNSLASFSSTTSFTNFPRLKSLNQR